MGKPKLPKVKRVESPDSSNVSILTEGDVIKMGIAVLDSPATEIPQADELTISNTTITTINVVSEFVKTEYLNMNNVYEYLKKTEVQEQFRSFLHFTKGINIRYQNNSIDNITIDVNCFNLEFFLEVYKENTNISYVLRKFMEKPSIMRCFINLSEMRLDLISMRSLTDYIGLIVIPVENRNKINLLDQKYDQLRSYQSATIIDDIENTVGFITEFSTVLFRFVKHYNGKIIHPVVKIQKEEKATEVLTESFKHKGIPVKKLKKVTITNS